MVLGLAPATAIFLLAEWLVLRGDASFAAVLSFGGVVGASLCAGIFPVLMLAAARRKGDVLPTAVHRGLGHPLLLGAIYALFLAAVVLHGLVIWEETALRVWRAGGGRCRDGADGGGRPARCVRPARGRRDPAGPGGGESVAFSVLNGGRPGLAGVDLLIAA